jgi:hypothetical protein
MPVRPTVRCLTDDLGLKIPTIDDPLDEFDHPLLRKANQQFAEPSSSRERISSIDAAVLFKVKAQRWRGAVWIDATGRPWMVAAGWREEGSQDDFYEALGHAARSARARIQRGTYPVADHRHGRDPVAAQRCGSGSLRGRGSCPADPRT